MNGGTVVGAAIDFGLGRTHVSVVDELNPGCECVDRSVSVHVAGRFFDSVRPGDLLWWEGRRAFWTPATNGPAWRDGGRKGVDYDIRLDKLGEPH